MTTPTTQDSPPPMPAPPPGSPPPGLPAGGAYTQEERLLAAASYLSYFTGFWMIVPIVVYVFMREKSRFVAHHALRAVLYHIVAIPVFVLGWVLSMVLTFGVAALVSHDGRGRGDLAGALLSVLWILGFASPWVLYILVCGLAAIRAFQGRMSTTSLFGRLVERFLSQDKTVARS